MEVSGHGKVFTIGHSNHGLEEFLRLLERHGIEALVDVRSHPRSRYAPHFDAAALKGSIGGAGLEYLFLGRELGGRPEADGFYDETGRVEYGLVAESGPFLDGISRLEAGIRKYRIALMCSEEDPRGCHRRLLVGRVLAGRGFEVLHIRGDGSLEEEAEVGGDQPPLFAGQEVEEWKSVKPIRSASPGRPPKSSSGR